MINGTPADRRRRADGEICNLLESPRPFFYLPLRQAPSAALALQIRTSQPPAALAPALVAAIHAIDGNVAPGEMITMREQVKRTTASQRIAVTILGVFGGVALLLAAIGLYGVMASTVAQSTGELALRLALGADSMSLLQTVMVRGIRLTLVGMAIGAAAAWQLTRLMGYLLYHVSPHDPAIFAAASAVLGATGAIACFVPAVRAMHTDPIAALRT